MAKDGYFARVYEIVARIPEGKVMTYGQIALLLGNPRSARVVGYAMRAAPGGLPCHRVVKKDGSLCGDLAFGTYQRTRLEEEGLPFHPDGRIDVRRSIWWP